MLLNKPDRYGLVSIVIHWVSALTVVCLAVLGLWMVDLDYYSEWYHRAPDLHRSIGVLLAMVLLLRMSWRWITPLPQPLGSHRKWEKKAARTTHVLMLLLLWCVIAAGYLISTADGRGVAVFDWFEIPATVTSIEHQEDLAGEVHFILAMVLLGLAGLHALVALKHHWVDRDPTLVRMLGRARRRLK